MTYTSRLIELIKRGREGDNQGLSLGMPKLEHIIDGLTQETYYLIAAGTGNGKTSFVLHSFIYKALLDSDCFLFIYMRHMVNKYLLKTYCLEARTLHSLMRIMS